MFKTVLFGIVMFPLVVIDAIASLVSVLVVALSRFAFKWYGAAAEYDDLFRTKIDGWTGLRNSLKID